jgi:ferredoxin
MRVVVDEDRCDGNGLCAAIAPALFAVADDDLVRVLAAELPAGAEPAAEEAAQACPKLALTLVDGN